MPKDIRKRPSLLMVTDTAMVEKDGKIFAFGPVVRELEVYFGLFDKVEWIGFNRPELYDDPVLLAVPDEVKCVLLKSSGGPSFKKKLGVLVQVPYMALIIFRSILRHKTIQTRAPSSPAFIAAILSFFFRQKTWWHKYAGNWGQERPPFFYGLQRKWLAMASWSKVTINGHWPMQPKHCITFENPCLDELERHLGAAAIEKKHYHGLLNLCFVGNLTYAKGVDRLMEAMPSLSGEKVAALHLIGDGPLRLYCREKAADLPFKTTFHGFLSRKEVGKIMAKCHILILPSQAEGFPKVVAEGANYGCIPVVSDISGIGQVIKHGENGFLLSPKRLQEGRLEEDLKSILNHPNLEILAKDAYLMAADFTFNRFSERIPNEIFS